MNTTGHPPDSKTENERLYGPVESPPKPKKKGKVFVSAMGWITNAVIPMIVNHLFSYL